MQEASNHDPTDIASVGVHRFAPSGQFVHKRVVFHGPRKWSATVTLNPKSHNHKLKFTRRRGTCTVRIAQIQAPGTLDDLDRCLEQQKATVTKLDKKIKKEEVDSDCRPAKRIRVA